MKTYEQIQGEERRLFKDIPEKGPRKHMGTHVRYQKPLPKPLYNSRQHISDLWMLTWTFSRWKVHTTSVVTRETTDGPHQYNFQRETDGRRASKMPKTRQGGYEHGYPGDNKFRFPWVARDQKQRAGRSPRVAHKSRHNRKST